MCQDVGQRLAQLIQEDGLVEECANSLFQRIILINRMTEPRTKDDWHIGAYFEDFSRQLVSSKSGHCLIGDETVESVGFHTKFFKGLQGISPDRDGIAQMLQKFFQDFGN